MTDPSRIENRMVLPSLSDFDDPDIEDFGIEEAEELLSGQDDYEAVLDAYNDDWRNIGLSAYAYFDIESEEDEYHGGPLRNLIVRLYNAKELPSQQPRSTHKLLDETLREIGSGFAPGSLQRKQAN